MGATSIGTDSREGGLLIRRGKQLEGAILLRETEGRGGRREGTEREREGIALPQVKASRINTVCQKHYEQLYSSASDREEKQTKKQCTINTEIQSIWKIIKRSLVCSSQNKLQIMH